MVRIVCFMTGIVSMVLFFGCTSSITTIEPDPTGDTLTAETGDPLIGENGDSFILTGDSTIESGDQEPDPCRGVTCSGHGTCSVLNETPICNCEVGFTANGLTCIENQHGYFVFNAHNYDVSEAATDVVITVQRKGGATGVASVSYSTERRGNGTSPDANDIDFGTPGDYNGETDVLLFADGQTERTFDVALIGDDVVEGNERFDVYLFAPTDGASLGAASQIRSTVTIIDDDEQPQVPGYTPFSLSDFEQGMVEQPAQGSNALESAVNSAHSTTTYSDTQALDNVGLSCRSELSTSSRSFGGEYHMGDTTIVSGDDLWMRHALYFPTDFCAGYAQSPDGWGATKWMRIEFSTATTDFRRLTLELGGFQFQGCGDLNIWGAAREYDGNANLRPPIFPTITRDMWHMVQWHVHMGDENTGFIRFWLDDQYLGQVDALTWPSDATQVNFIMYGDYYNGYPYRDLLWYMDDVIMSTETPDTLDAGGRPYIAPSARVSDWQ